MEPKDWVHQGSYVIPAAILAEMTHVLGARGGGATLDLFLG